MNEWMNIYIYTSKIPTLWAGFPASSCRKQRALWARSLPRFARQTICYIIYTWLLEEGNVSFVHLLIIYKISHLKSFKFVFITQLWCIHMMYKYKTVTWQRILFDINFPNRLFCYYLFYVTCWFHIRAIIKTQKIIIWGFAGVGGAPRRYLAARL